MSANEVLPAVSFEDFKEPPTIFDPTTCTCPVTKIRHQAPPLESHSLYYEIHGFGPEKVVFIMGLNSSSVGWLCQVDHFGRKLEYSVLVFDNRGVGNSGAPCGPYTCDTIILLDYVGWTEKHQVHVVGVSFGGMIAQELASRIPERIASLCLTVTMAGRRIWMDVPPYGLYKAIQRTTVRDREKQIPVTLELLFTKPWLDAKDPTDPEGRTNREIEMASWQKQTAVTRPQPILGTVSQIAAAVTHYVSPVRLRKISSTVPKVLIIAGDADIQIDPSSSYHLKKDMPEADLIVKGGAGHGIPFQCKRWFNDVLERTFKEGRERSSSE